MEGVAVLAPVIDTDDGNPGETVQEYASAPPFEEVDLDASRVIRFVTV